MKLLDSDKFDAVLQCFHYGIEGIVFLFLLSVPGCILQLPQDSVGI